MLKTLRKQRKLTQKQLANLCGLRQNYISMLERNPSKTNPTVQAIIDISEALDVPHVDIYLYFAKSKLEKNPK